ncbi:deoxyribodipyrimidine photo-lyase/cryptochrome family protein [Inhella sp.]|uniref:cryptochrome/deoxyribodipyrimidine photo-lyase family protein n=1 Tax=Inhella sp. TaxID=1921806 RepID=UPI0035B435AD
MSTALVWLKRDLRLHDHAPLMQAAACERAAAVYFIEPEWLASPEFDPQHLRFVLESLAELRARLQRRGLPLHVRVRPAVQGLAELQQELGFTHLFSHEETGPGWTYARDLAVAVWCRAQGVAWLETPQHGVVRRLRSRAGWAARWQARMDTPECAPPSGWRAAGGLCEQALPSPADLGIAPDRRASQRGGERAARATLESFLQARGQDYRRALSSPLSAEAGCSRLSPHLAFGTLSLRRAHQATERRIDAARGLGERDWAYALRGFAGRLRWHCHFMQKLEDEPAIEFRAFAPAFDGLRPGDEHPEAPPWDAAAQVRFAAWCEGRTGWPMVDACMRSLCATGWLNFRMRALLVSVAAYPLWLHWRPVGLHLARQFLDFEAGIHWSQLQMQSGCTGINALRVYSPTKQARDQDPEGHFIRRWVPELAGVPTEWLAEPWRMPASVQQRAGCRIGSDYPAPLGDERAAIREAKDRLWAARRSPQARAQADAVQQKHGSRKSGLPPSPKPRAPRAPLVPATQGELF